MKIEREIIDKSTNSPRLSDLRNFFETWLEKYQEDDNEDDFGINLIMIGYDEKYQHSIKFSLTSKENPEHDIFNAINKGIGSLKDNVGRDIFNGMCEYLGRVFATYPKLYDIFKENVEDIKRNYEENQNNKEP